MASKSIKGKNAGGKSAPNSGNEIPKKEPSKSKNEIEDDDEYRCIFCRSRFDEYGYCACGGNLGID